MTSQHDKPKRWRLRFSVRTLVVVLTLVCCYAACWGPTKRDGSRDVRYHVNETWEWPATSFDESPRLPLIVNVLRIDASRAVHDEYYFWFFGFVAKLPYEREIEPDFDFSVDHTTFGSGSAVR